MLVLVDGLLAHPLFVNGDGLLKVAL